MAFMIMTTAPEKYKRKISALSITFSPWIFPIYETSRGSKSELIQRGTKAKRKSCYSENLMGSRKQSRWETPTTAKMTDSKRSTSRCLHFQSISSEMYLIRRLCRLKFERSHELPFSEVLQRS